MEITHSNLEWAILKAYNKKLPDLKNYQFLPLWMMWMLAIQKLEWKKYTRWKQSLLVLKLPTFKLIKVLAKHNISDALQCHCNWFKVILFFDFIIEILYYITRIEDYSKYRFASRISSPQICLRIVIKERINLPLQFCVASILHFIYSLYRDEINYPDVKYPYEGWNAQQVQVLYSNGWLIPFQAILPLLFNDWKLSLYQFVWIL